jgi:hypothetical protein
MSQKNATNFMCTKRINGYLSFEILHLFLQIAFTIFPLPYSNVKEIKAPLEQYT